MLTINLGDNVRLDLELIVIDQLTFPIFFLYIMSGIRNITTGNGIKGPISMCNIISIKPHILNSLPDINECCF